MSTARSRCWRPWRLSAALLVGAWGHGDAQARPRMWELQMIVICGGDGAETVMLDRHGTPVDPRDCPHTLCLDCIAAPALFAPGPDAAAQRPGRLRRFRPIPVVQRADLSRRWSDIQPRGPPAQTRD